MAGKITDYPTMTLLKSGDLIDVSDFDGVATYTSKSLDYDDLVTSLEGDITFRNIYSNDGTLAGNRIVSMGVNDLTFGSTGDVNLLRFDSTSDRIGIGTAAPTAKLEVVGNAYINGRLGVNAPPFGNAASYLISISGDLYGKRILADNLAANGYGLYVRSTSPTNNFGIFGKSTTTGSGSESSGVEGISDGTNGTNHYGVRGRGKNGSSLSFGGYFQIEGGASIVAANRTSAVYGLNQSTNSGQNIAIQGISLSTSGISYGLKAEATGAATTNYGGYFRATTATNNYAIIVPSGGGNVGIGTVTPTESLEVAGKVLITQTDGLQLNQLNGRITIGNTISSTTHFLLRGTRPTLIDLGDATTSRFSVGANAQTIINYTSATGTIFRINRISENFAFTVRGDDGNVGIGVGSAPSRKLHVAGGLKLDSTTEALQVMRMTTTQRDALTAATGDIVYNTTTSKHQGYNGSVWNDLY